jgi:hypothetical protein
MGNTAAGMRGAATSVREGWGRQGDGCKASCKALHSGECEEARRWPPASEPDEEGALAAGDCSWGNWPLIRPQRVLARPLAQQVLTTRTLIFHLSFEKHCWERHQYCCPRLIAYPAMSVARRPVDLGFARQLPKIEVVPTAVKQRSPFAALLTVPDPAPRASHRQHQSGMPARHLGDKAGPARCTGNRRPPACHTSRKGRL